MLGSSSGGIPRPQRSMRPTPHIPQTTTDEVLVANCFEGAPGLCQVVAIVAGNEPERQVVALRPALGVDAHPASLLNGRLPPEIQVRAAKTLEERQQLVHVVLVVAQPFYPQVLVVADERRLVVSEDPSVPSAGCHLGVGDVPDALQDRPFA